MKNFKQLLTRPLQIIPKGYLTALFILALVGFCVATYLTIQHYLNEIPPCSIGGCEVVLTSIYSSVFGIPVSLFGSAFYFTILVALIAFWDSKKEIFVRYVTIISILGAIVALFLLALMAFIIKSLCFYCVISDVITLAIAIISILILKKNKINEVSI